jgi:prevent-host-death family protein
MITAGIKDLKNNLSRYLARVKMGEDVIITERGKTVARIIKEDPGHASIRIALASLVEKGLIILPSHTINKEILSPVKVPGKPVSEMVIEDRR